jgi:hypothetical protein
MKYFPLIRFAIVGLFLTTLAGCLRDECTSTRTYVRFDPVYKLPADFRVGVSAEAPRSLQKPGKIYAYGPYLFINELQEGIHVINNSDPSNPQNIAFWKIPGNVDMAIQGDYLYADQYVDLLTIDISDVSSPKVICTQQDAFYMLGFVPGQGYITEYKPTEVTEQISCGDENWNQPWFRRGGVFFAEADMAVNLTSSFANPSQGGFATQNSAAISAGIAGSYARFAIQDDYLYTVDNSMLRSWSIQNPTCPTKVDSMYSGWNIETIFPWKGRLFLGSQTGVFIYNASNPAHPVMETAFSHANGCDPVVCDDNNAYVTIHDGTTCNGTFNQLDVIDITNLPTATLTKSYNMTRPMGLSVTNEHLFVCDNGLKIFDKSNPADLKELAHLSNIVTYDVIALSDDLLFVSGDGGFYEFDVSDPANPRQVSLMPVVK